VLPLVKGIVPVNCISHLHNDGVWSLHVKRCCGICLLDVCLAVLKHANALTDPKA
jgi:hypothetical protein